MHKVLIANRGEIAVRIIRTCRDLGIQTVAVCSLPDLHAMHTALADESICIGEGPATESYLQISSILAAAELTGSDAIHPGYGFLSENPRFPELCACSGVQFIGPTAAAMSRLGNKLQAKTLAMQCGIPTIPSSPRLETLEEAWEWADRLGFPVLLKTACGGGGRGIRVVTSPQELEDSWNAVQAESKAAYGRAELYLEKKISPARHVEVQVVGDLMGEVMALGERDCSVQRRRQKLLEEAPCVWLEEPLRQQLYEAACALARCAGYHSLGTAEFLVDTQGRFYFMEFNSRLQVEHTVTELVMGIDLVALQIELARGMALPKEWRKKAPLGHAIQVRINAENPREGFQPSPGCVEKCRWPSGPGVRVDTSIEAGSTVPPYYDALLGKVIVHAQDREQARVRLLRAMREISMQGVSTNVPLQNWILETEAFQRGVLSVEWLEEVLEEFLSHGDSTRQEISATAQA